MTSNCEQCFSRQLPPVQLGYYVFSLFCQLKTTDCALILCLAVMFSSVWLLGQANVHLNASQKLLYLSLFIFNGVMSLKGFPSYANIDWRG